METNRIETVAPYRRRTRAIDHALNVLLMVAGVVAVASLILEYGFREIVLQPKTLHSVQLAIVGIFILDRLFRLFIAHDRKEYFRNNFIDFLLMAVAVLFTAFNFNAVLSYGALYVLLTQAYILVVLLLRGISLNLRIAESGLPPSWLLMGSFFLLILAGACLLMLPKAVRPEYYANWYFPHALFTATSAACVTGLVVVDTGQHFTPFGQAVILLLIQAGGLGIMLFGTMLGLLMGKALSMKQSNALGQMISSEDIGSMARVAMFVILVTVIFEVAGAIALYPMFSKTMDTFGQPLGMGGALWYSVFHSVSAFCNAGFSLYGNNLMQGLGQNWPDGALREHWQIMGVFAPLIVLGGLGFPVLQDTAQYAINAVRRRIDRWRTAACVVPTLHPVKRLTLHTKLVLVTSLVLIVLGAALFLMLEGGHNTTDQRVGRHGVGRFDARGGDWAQMSWPKRIESAVFQSITARTAGFNTISMAEMTDAGKFWTCLLMIVGGSPASTAGGMKTITIALLLLAVYSQLRRRNEIEAFHRSVAPVILGRVVTILVLYLCLLLTVTLLLCASQGPGYPFIDLLFEACSACGTVGLSTGITSSLSEFGKMTLIVGMFIGRLGPLTLLLAANARLRPARYAYPTGQVIIG